MSIFDNINTIEIILIILLYICPLLFNTIYIGIPAFFEKIEDKEAGDLIWGIPLFLSMMCVCPILNLCFTIFLFCEAYYSIDYSNKFWKKVGPGIIDYIPALLPLITLLICLIWL